MLELNEKRLELILDKLPTKPELKKAAFLYFFNGMSMYEAEKKSGCKIGTLTRKVKRITEELKYIEKMAKADNTEYQYSIV